MAKDVDQYDEVSDGQGPSKALVAMIVANLVITLGLAGFVAYDFVTRPDGVAGGQGGATAGESGANEPPQPAAIYTFEPFVVNLMDSANIRYVKVMMEVELSSADVLVEIEEKKPMLRDMVISLLSNRTYGELLGVRGKTQLREEMLRRMNQILADGSITRIYFTEFVVQ